MKDEPIQLSKAAYIQIYKCLNDECSEWPTIVKVAIRDGIEKAKKLLQNAKGSVIQVLKKHKSLVRSLTQGATGIGIAADVAQAGLEHYGYKKTGKAVGASGNIASGALCGVAFGPVGAGVGAMVGLGVWGTGEVVDMLFEQ
uniref:Uncharacterized protein n=1 Tax=Amphimedon queenslandica TaxID=400682 RepID=A0A1X7TIZ6_AMPQE